MLLELGFEKYAAVNWENAGRRVGNMLGRVIYGNKAVDAAEAARTVTKASAPIEQVTNTKPSYFKTLGKFMYRHPGKAAIIGGTGIVVGTGASALMRKDRSQFTGE